MAEALSTVQSGVRVPNPQARNSKIRLQQIQSYIKHKKTYSLLVKVYHMSVTECSLKDMISIGREGGNLGLTVGDINFLKE